MIPDLEARVLEGEGTPVGQVAPGIDLRLIRVTDDGPGIPEEKRDFVLRPMTKLVSRDVDPGAGMGLAILRKVAQTYGGEVRVLDGKSGVGTQVEVTVRVN